MTDAAAEGTVRAQELLSRFLAGRSDRTLHAYRTDIDDFARFVGGDVATTVAQLLTGGGDAGRRLGLEYAIDLRKRGRAPATVDRRLATLRALTGLAYEVGELAWTLDVPGEAEVTAALEARSASDVPYLFPRHTSDVDRLDVQHHALRETFGANYLAPIERVDRALDVGCGTGQWSFELCRRFPNALVVGLDLVPSKPDRPSGYRWVRTNLLTGLPLAGDRFDFVYQRLLVVGVPIARWQPLVDDLVRVTRPGGWVELVEPVVGVIDPGPATERLVGLSLQLAGAAGLDTTDVVYRSLDSYLRRAGLAEVVRRQISTPIGRWGGRVGSFMATDLRVALTRMSEVLRNRLGVPADECNRLVQQAHDETDRLRMSFNFAVAFGRKP